MEVHGSPQGFTQLLLSIEVPGLDWPGLDREDAIQTEDECSSPSWSVESGRSGSSGGFHGELGAEIRPVICSGSSDLSESPPSMGSGNKSSHDFEEEQLTPEYSHVTASESPKSTHYTNKRPYDVIVEDDYPDVPAVGSSDSPTEPDTWVKRPRFGKIPDFRTAKNGRKSTLELKMRKFGNRNSDEVVASQPGMEFDSLPEAFDFFNLYSWEVGFGIRYRASRKNKQGSMTMQEILCGCASHSKLQ